MRDESKERDPELTLRLELAEEDIKTIIIYQKLV